MEERLSLKQALEMTRDILAGISVPVALIEQIGAPVASAVANLNACIDAINEQEENKDGNADAG